jgi:hypothetical protein
MEFGFDRLTYVDFLQGRPKALNFFFGEGYRSQAKAINHLPESHRVVRNVPNSIIVVIEQY